MYGIKTKNSKIKAISKTAKLPVSGRLAQSVVAKKEMLERVKKMKQKEEK